MFRFSRLAAVVVLLAAAAACEPTITPLPVPDGLPLSSLTPAQRALLRATLAIDDVRDEATVVLDADALTISGDLELSNVGDGGQKTATLRIYGRASAESEEVLLGLATSTVTITPRQPVYLDFKGAAFETCAAGVDGACSLLFDRNRNGDSNVVDLVAAIDPAPAAPFLQVSPSTLQFSSGIRLGEFARQVVVVENLADHQVRLGAVQVAGGQGVGVSLFDPNSGTNSTPRRRLTSTELDIDSPADGVSDIVLNPGEEVFVAVSFAPVNAFLTTASIQLAATDVVTGVGQGVRTKVIANSDGALRPRDAAYAEPGPSSINLGGGTLTTEAFPSTELFSGSEVTSTSSDAGLVHTGVSLVAARADGTTLAMPADAAFAIDVAPGQRFAAALDADDDVDLALLELLDDGTFTVLSTSQQQGDSSEAVELLNDQANDRSVVLVLGRVGVFAPVAVAGALVAADQPLPFRLSCQLTRGPELDDVEPISPTRGRLDGGDEITIRGRGFYVPATSAGPHARVSVGGEPVVTPPRIVTAEDGTQTLTIVLPAGTNSISDVLSTVVVENPSTAGGDGQAATLPEGFRYDLPTARITRVTPDVASTAGSTVDVTVRGAFFFDLYGTPIVRFDDVPATDVSVVDSTTLLVTVPAHDAATTQLTVTNAVFGGLEGAASNGVDFTFVAPQGPAPTLTAVAPSSGTSLGGDSISLTGAGFVAGTRVFLGGNEAAVTGSTQSTLTVVTAPVDAAGAVDVAVVNPDGQTAVLAAAFTFSLPPPSITATFPERATVGGNTIVVVAGAGFRDDTTVSFVTAAGSVDARSVTRTSSTSLLVTTPVATAGAAQLIARNADGQQASVPFSFFAPDGPPPSALTINPSTGNVGGGTAVSLTATGVQAPVVIVFGDTLIDDANVVPLANGRTRIDLVTPPGEAGNTAVSLVNSDGQTATTTFTYIDTDEPRLVGLRPAVVHALVPGDEILGFGEHLNQLGSTSSLRATALVQGGRVPLTVQFGSDGFVSLLVELPLPAGSVAIELSGAGGTIVSEQRLTAEAPNVTRAEFNEGSPNIVLVGSALAGERLTAVVVGGAPCVVTSADDRSIACRLTEDPAEAVVELHYGAIVIIDDQIPLVEGEGGEQCSDATCNGRGACEQLDGGVACVCNATSFGPRCESCAEGFGGPTCSDLVGDPILVDATCSLAAAVRSINNGVAEPGCVLPVGTKLVRLTTNVQLVAADGPVFLDDISVDGAERTINVVGTAFVLRSGTPRLNNLKLSGAAAANVVIVDANAFLTNVKFSGISGPASALVINQGRTATLEEVVFENVTNTAGPGGAITVHGGLNVRDSQFSNNGSVANGGAIFVSDTGNLQAQRSFFRQNTSGGSGGAIHLSLADTSLVDRCAFLENNGAQGAGALHANNTAVHVRQSTFVSNSTQAGDAAGAILATGGQLDISSSTITKNAGIGAGGVRVSGGAMRIKDSILVGNSVQVPQANHDLAADLAEVGTFGFSLVGASNIGSAALVTGDPALFGTPFGGNSVAAAVLRPSPGIADPALATGSCSDLNGVALDVDQAGAPRPTTGCTLGAVEADFGPVTTIVVDNEGDDNTGCTLRSAVTAAAFQASVVGCTPGGARNRIVFSPGVTRIELQTHIEIGGTPSLVIDGFDGHENDVVTIHNDGGRPLAITSPTALLGLRLEGGASESTGGALLVTSSARLVETSLVDGSAVVGAGAFVTSGGVLTVSRSEVANQFGATTDGEAIAVNQGTVLLDRSSILGVTFRSLVHTTSPSDLVVVNRATLNSVEAVEPMFAGPGRVVVRQSILNAPGRPLCDSESRSNYTGLGESVLSDDTCFARNDDRLESFPLAGFGFFGGRTRSFSVLPTSSIASMAPCTPGDVDQRGRVITTTQCAPGAFFAGTGECGDGFVDASSGTALVVDDTFGFGFTGTTLVGTGQTPAGRGLVALDDASGFALLCTPVNGCGPGVSTGVLNAVAVGLGDMNADTVPDVVVLHSDGSVTGHDGFDGTEVFSSAFVFLDGVVDGHVFDNEGVVSVFGIGTADGQPFAELSEPAGGLLVGGLAVGLNGAPQPGIALRNRAGLLHLLVRTFQAGGTVSTNLVTYDPAFDSMTFTPDVPGTITAAANVPSTIAVDDDLWGAQQIGFSVSIGRFDGNVDKTVPFDAQTLTAGSVDGDGRDEIIAVGRGGEVEVFQQQQPFDWVALGATGQALADARCFAADLDGTPAAELVCTSANALQVSHFEVGSVLEACDPGNAFGGFCSQTCTPGP